MDVRVVMPCAWRMGLKPRKYFVLASALGGPGSRPQPQPQPEQSWVGAWELGLCPGYPGTRAPMRGPCPKKARRSPDVLAQPGLTEGSRGGWGTKGGWSKEKERWPPSS